MQIEKRIEKRGTISSPQERTWKEYDVWKIQTTVSDDANIGKHPDH